MASRKRKARPSTKAAWRGTTFASNFEKDFAKYLTKLGIEWEYEADSFKWFPNPRVYHPDFKITKPDGTCFYIETKGYFDGSSRAKMAAIKKQFPELDVRMVFMDPRKKVSTSAKTPTTYAEWADKHGFMWSSFTLPKEWRREANAKLRKKDLESDFQFDADFDDGDSDRIVL